MYSNSVQTWTESDIKTFVQEIIANAIYQLKNEQVEI
jgi:hypothetical protein